MTVLRLKLAAITVAASALSEARLENVRQCLLAVFAHTGADPQRYSQASPDDLHATAELSRSVFSRARGDATRLGLLRDERPRVRRGQKRPPNQLWINHDEVDRLVARSREAPSPEAIGGPSGGIRWDQVGSL